MRINPIATQRLTEKCMSTNHVMGIDTHSRGESWRRLEDALVYHLPDDYFSSYVQKIQAVTAADVQRVAQKYIAPGRFAVVVVGDEKTIEPRIQSLNLGPIKKLTVDDVFGPKP